MTATYIQHNPNVPTGRQGFIDFFSRFVKTQPIVDTIKGPLIAIVAEGDLVVGRTLGRCFKTIANDVPDRPHSQK